MSIHISSSPFRMSLVIMTVLLGACTSPEPDGTTGQKERAGEPSSPEPSPAESPREQPDTTGEPARSRTITAAAAGDISEAELGDQADTSDLMVDEDPDRVLVLGDSQYPDGSAEEFSAYYDPTWGRFKDRTLPAPGNHDKYGPSDYEEYFDPPGPWYSVDAGNWHLVSLDSNQADDEDQHEFLDDDLARDDHGCELAFWHHSRWSSGSDHGSSDAVQPLWKRVVDSGVDLVLTAHDHTYERFGRLDRDGRPDANGTVQIVVGTGGAEQHDDFFDDPETGSKVRIGQQDGVLFLRLEESSYSGEYRTVDGRVRDRFDHECR
jgi:acid phosphatase type 7